MSTEDQLTLQRTRTSSRKTGKTTPWGAWFPVIIVFIGAIILMYPVCSTIYNNMVISEVADEYSQVLRENSDAGELRRQLQAAREYNRTRTNGPILDPWLSRVNSDNQNYQEYLQQLGKVEVMARLTIPSIEVDLPVFHGTSDDVLTRGVGHLYGSDLPVGGEDVHSVLTGHTGLTTSTLFDNLTELKVGRSIYLNVYGETLRYVVASTEVVLPDETGSLRKQKGKDLLTLITCTPYGVNSHRLLVHAERAPFDKSAEAELVQSQGFQLETWMLVFMSIGGVSVVAALVLNFSGRRASKGNRRHQQSKSSQSGSASFRQNPCDRRQAIDESRTGKNDRII